MGELEVSFIKQPRLCTVYPGMACWHPCGAQKGLVKAGPEDTGQLPGQGICAEDFLEGGRLCLESWQS